MVIDLFIEQHILIIIKCGTTYTAQRITSYNLIGSKAYKFAY